MIKYGYNDKNLVVPSGLGFGGAKSGGGSGGGVTPEEVAEIASGITEEAIDEYDTELQVDLEEIREAVSGNTEAIGNLSDSLSAYTTDSELQQALQGYATTAQTQAISDSLSNYATTAQTQGIAGNVTELSGATQAIEQSLGNYATTADTQSIQNSLANYATTAVTDGLETEISGITASVATLSGKVKEDVYLDVAVIDNMSYADRKVLWDEVYAKVVDGYKVFAKGIVQNSPTYTAILPLDRYCPETNTETHVGGFLYFAAKDSEENSYFCFTFSSNGNLNGLSSSSRLNKTNIYNLGTASSSTLGGVKVGTGLTIDSNSKLSISSAITAEIAGKEDKHFVLELSTLDESNLTNEDKANIDALFAYLDGKTIDEVNAVLANPDDGQTVYNLTSTDGQNMARFNALWGWGGEEVYIVKEVDEGTGDDVYLISVDEWYVNDYYGGNGIDINDGEITVKIAKGMYFDENGRLSIGLGSGLTLQSSTELALRVGDGLGFSGNTLVVSGGTGGGIEKVSELPQDAEEGDMVWLEGETFTGYTILCAYANDSTVFESGYNFLSVDGNEYELTLYNFPIGRWFTHPDISDIKMRVRFTEDDYTILDVYDTSDSHTIAAGSDAEDIDSDIEFPMRSILYVYQNGQWFRKGRFEWVYNADEAEDLMTQIYCGIEEFGLEDFVMRWNPDNDGDLREFVPYVTGYFGMDLQCTDSRGRHDWGQIKVFCYRLNFDGTLSDLVGEQQIVTTGQIPYPSFNDIELEVDISGNMSSEHLGEFSSLNAFNRFVLKYSDPNIQNNYCSGPLEYFYRKTETINGEDKLVEYIGGNININGTKYRGTWHFNEWEWGGTVSPDTWTTV